MIYPWDDFIKGSVKVTPQDILKTILGEIELRGPFTYDTLFQLFKDSEYLALDIKQAEKWARKCNYRALMHGNTGKQEGDCDDNRALFCGDRVWNRWKAGIAPSEAFGGVDYWSNSRKEMHYPEYAVVKDGNRLRTRIYQTDTGEWHEADEAEFFVYCDA